MSLRPFYLAGILAVAGATIAFAEPPADGGDCRHGRGDHGARMIDMIDTDNDGKVTKTEAQAASTAHFDRLDANDDGVITPDEAERMFRPQPDANGDGKITAAELAAIGDARFAKRDANGDGVLSDDELKPPHGRHHGGDDGPGDE